MVLTKEKRGTYELEKSVQRFIQYQLSLVKKNLGTSKADEETRLTKAKADLAEIELATAQRELIPVTDAVKILADNIGAAKTRFLGIPSSIKSKHPDFPISAMNFLESEIRFTLSEMATRDLPEIWNQKKGETHDNKHHPCRS